MSRFVRVAGTTLVAVSVTLYAFLGRWEGASEYTAYADKLAGGLPTVCRGLTKHVTDTPIIVGQKWSKEKCETEEVRAIERVQKSLANCFKLPPPQSVFDAASSHAWNFGYPSTCTSGAMAAWNIGDWTTGCRRIYQNDAGRPAWSFVKTGRVIDGKAEYKFVQGLANRRFAEYEYCMRDVK